MERAGGKGGGEEMGASSVPLSIGGGFGGGEGAPISPVLDRYTSIFLFFPFLLLIYHSSPPPPLECLF